MKNSTPQRLYYSIKEVGELFDEEQHILRYWEREFGCLRPSKNRAGNRVYTEKDLNTLRVIKKLLRVDRVSISEARNYLQRGVTDDMVAEAIRSLKIFSTIDAQPNTGIGVSPLTSSTPSDGAVSTEKSGETSYRLQQSDKDHLIAVLKSIAEELESLD